MSNGSFIRKRVISVVPDNDVIKNGNVQQKTAIPDLLCDFVVGYARLEIAAGMIVS